MSDSNSVDHKRRRMLVAGTSVIGASGVGALGVSFLSSWQPSARALNAGAPVEQNISKLQEGQKLNVIWQGKPVWIIKRSKATLSDLSSNEKLLVDPQSSVNTQQPEYARNEGRSIKPEILVTIGICTHLGCSPTYRPDVGDSEMGADWKGGLYCPCHGSRFDMSGRVFKNVPAHTNLLVPPHYYKSDDVILIGEDEGAA